MALKDETADKLYQAIQEAAGQTKDIQALHVLSEAFSFVAGTGAGTRGTANPRRGVSG